MNVIIYFFREVGLGVCFSDYRGNREDVEGAKEFISQKFISLNKDPKRVYPHAICAMESKIIECIYEDVKVILLRTQSEMNLF